MNLSELANESLAELYRALEQLRDGTPSEDLHSAFIFRHGLNIYELGHDALALEQQNRSRTSRILVRPMLDSLFNLVAAVKDPAFVPAKLVDELEYYIKQIRKWTAPGQFLTEIADSERRAREIRAKHSVTGNRQWNSYETAKTSGLESTQGLAYVVLSGYIHSTSKALMVSEQEIDRDLVLNSIPFAALTAAESIETGIFHESSSQLLSLLQDANKLTQSRHASS